MRQRKAKDLDKRLEACRDFIKEAPDDKNWELLFGDADISADFKTDDEKNKPELYLEIGCGKGQFIIKKAADNPDRRYIAIEGQETVILRAAEKARAVAGRIPWPENVSGEERLENIRIKLEQCDNPLSNLVFTAGFVEKMSDFFEENQLSGVYLNFSDPWPKARHAKRRLTYRNRLLDYARSIKPGGFIEIKTDNEGLFEFTLEEIKACEGRGIEKIEMTRDLHGDDIKFESADTTTEYEDKFSCRGKNINYVKVNISK